MLVILWILMAQCLKFCYSVSGMLQISGTILSLIVVICASDAVKKCIVCGPTGFMMNIGIVAVIASCIFITVFSFNLREKLQFVHWPLTELLSSGITFILYLLGSCWVVANIEHGDADTAVVIFGFIAATVYAVITRLAFLESRERYRNQQTQSTTHSVVTTIIVEEQ